MKIETFIVFIALSALLGCTPEPTASQLPVKVEAPEADNASPVRIGRLGRMMGGPVMPSVYQKQSLDSLPFPVVDAQAVQALERNLRLLKLAQGRRNYQIGDLRIQHQQLQAVSEILAAWQHTPPVGLGKYLEAHRIWGRDQRGNVQFTGYFTPVIKVSRSPKGRFKYPIYSRPLEWDGPLPTRAEIEGEGVFEGLGLELAYAANKVDLYYMQVQGSGYVEYPDGQRELFAYNGSNRHPYRSIEKYLIERPDLDVPKLSIAGIRSFLQQQPELTDSVLFQNPSYTFFIRQKTLPSGAGNVPLTPLYSIAVDRRYIPLGSCLLAAFPVFNPRKQRVTHHEYRLLVAQDVGGAIRGPGHVDYYTGIGADASRIAGNLKAYGHLWLLLPRQRTPKVIATGLEQ